MVCLLNIQHQHQQQAEQGKMGVERMKERRLLLILHPLHPVWLGLAELGWAGGPRHQFGFLNEPIE